MDLPNYILGYKQTSSDDPRVNECGFSASGSNFNEDSDRNTGFGRPFIAFRAPEVTKKYKHDGGNFDQRVKKC
jgi:hypothetical protein